MVLYPDAQARAQSELDAVLGKGVLPSFNNMNEEDLPFLMAVVKESLRWNPVAPFGIPHKLIEDDVYKGYTLPKDTIVIPNTWYVNMLSHFIGRNSWCLWTDDGMSGRSCMTTRCIQIRLPSNQSGSLPARGNSITPFVILNWRRLVMEEEYGAYI